MKTRSPSGERKRGWKRKVLLVLLAGLAALVLAEVLLRVCGVSYPVFHQADELAGHRLLAGMEGLQTVEGRAYVRINSGGWRDREHPREKPPDTLRIAVLGDSYAEAMQVDLEETFWSVIERTLSTDPAGRRVEVLNFGVSGYGTGQQLITLEHRVWSYSPDVVLLAFVSGNDVSDNSRDLKQVDYAPYFVLEGDELKLDTSYRDSGAFKSRNSETTRWFVNASRYSRLLQLFNRMRVNLRQRRRARELVEDAGAGPRGEPGLALSVYREPESRTWKDAWRVTEALILRMAHECRSRKVRFAVVSLSNAEQVNPDAAAHRELKDALGVEDLFYPERRLEKLGETTGFPVLSLAPLLLERARKTGIFFHGFGETLGEGHWNEAGHLAAGRLIADWLRREVLVETFTEGN